MYMKPFRSFEERIYEVIKRKANPGEILVSTLVELNQEAGYRDIGGGSASLAMHALELRGFIKKIGFKKYMRII